MFSKYLLMGIGLLVMTNLATGYMLKGAWQDVAVAEANVEVARNAVDEAVANKQQSDRLYQAELIKAAELSGEFNDIQEAKDEADRKLEAFRGRLEATAIGRPTLIGRLATRATAGRMRAIYCASTPGADICAPPDLSPPETAGD